MENAPSGGASLLLAARDRIECMKTMEPRAKIVPAAESLPEHIDSHTESAVDRGEPPKIYLAACGALCDIFWWARRTRESPK